MRNRWMIVGVAVLVVGLATWHSGWAVCRDDVPTARERRILEGFECVLVKKETKVSSGCSNSPGVGCIGACYEGVFAESARICKQKPGSVCVGKREPVLVIWTHEGVCLSNCSCEELAPLPRARYDVIEAYRCNT